MSELVNGRTPEEIKAALCVCISEEACNLYGCYYSADRNCRDSAMRDALAYIQRLESERDAAMAKVPKWISVEERLPESGVHVFVCCERTGYMGYKTQYVCDGFYAGKYKVKVGWRDEDTAAEYSEEDDEFYLEEGWYEVIKNWGDYDSVVIDDRPTHWMFMHEPPKEESNA